MEILWLWENKISLSFVLLAPHPTLIASPLRWSCWNPNQQEHIFLATLVPKVSAIPGVDMKWMPITVLTAQSFLVPFWTHSGSRGALQSRPHLQPESVLKNKTWVVGPQSDGSGYFSLNPGHTWSRRVLPQLQGYFVRASKQESWLFFLLIPLLVTMELCCEFSTVRPRQALRNIIASKTLQGLIREILSPPKMPRAA